MPPYATIAVAVWPDGKLWSATSPGSRIFTGGRWRVSTVVAT